MDQTVMTMTNNLIIMSSVLSSQGGDDDLPFPHAWALLLWVFVTLVVALICVMLVVDWTIEVQYRPELRLRIWLLIIAAIAISILSGVIPLAMGL